MFEIGELANLCVDLCLLPILVAVLRNRKNVPSSRLLLAATLLLVLGHAATLAEGFFWPRFFDAVEHLSVAAAGFCFLATLGSFAGRRIFPGGRGETP